MTEPSLQFRWLGVAGIELTVGGCVLTVDPFFTRPSFWRVGCGRVMSERALAAAIVPRCDYVLITHTHYDHAMDAPEVARATGAVVLGSPNTCDLMAACGVPVGQIRLVSPGDRLSLGPFEVDVMDGQHMRWVGPGPGKLARDLRPPLRLHDYRLDVCLSFLIRIAGRRLLVWHSIFPKLAPPADVLFLGALESRKHYVHLLREMHPRLVVPLHWDNFFRPLGRPIRPLICPARWAWPSIRRPDPARFARMVRDIAPDVQVLVPQLLGRYDLEQVLTDFP